MLVKCDECGKEIKICPSLMKRYKFHFCSNLHKHNYVSSHKEEWYACWDEKKKTEISKRYKEIKKIIKLRYPNDHRKTY